MKFYALRLFRRTYIDISIVSSQLRRNPFGSFFGANKDVRRAHNFDVPFYTKVSGLDVKGMRI